MSKLIRRKEKARGETRAQSNWGTRVVMRFPYLAAGSSANRLPLRLQGHFCIWLTEG